MLTNRWTNMWVSLNKNPTFIAFRGAFLGALFTALQSAYDAGHLCWNAKALTHMAIGAVIVSCVSVFHLYLPSPSSAQTKQQDSVTAQTQTDKQGS